MKAFKFFLFLQCLSTKLLLMEFDVAEVKAITFNSKSDN